MHDTNRIYWIMLALSGLLWVTLGAATGHEPLPAHTAVYFEKAHRYHIIHTLAGMAVCLAPLTWKSWIINLWTSGIILFSGSLYLMALTGAPLRYIVPIGGMAFIAGWLALLANNLKKT